MQPDQVTRVLINPINVASESVRGLDLKGNWRFDAATMAGSPRAWPTPWCWSTSTGSSPMIRRDIRNSLDDYQWRSKANGSITWNQGDWTTTLYGNRFGSLPKTDGSGRIAPYMTYNASVFRQFGENLSVGVIVNNLRDNARRRTGTVAAGRSTVGNYDPYGRQYWVQLDYRFR